MSSKNTHSRKNSLFLDTSVFNTTSRDYISELNKPGILERLNSTSFEDPSSLMYRKESEANLSFGYIRDKSKLTRDVSQMAKHQVEVPYSPKVNFKGGHSGFDTEKLHYDRDSKACIPHYSIKNSKLPNLLPFFAPEKTRNAAARRASQ